MASGVAHSTGGEAPCERMMWGGGEGKAASSFALSFFFFWWLLLLLLFVYFSIFYFLSFLLSFPAWWGGVLSERMSECIYIHIYKKSVIPCLDGCVRGIAKAGAVAAALHLDRESFLFYRDMGVVCEKRVRAALRFRLGHKPALNMKQRGKTLPVCLSYT